MMLYYNYLLVFANPIPESAWASFAFLSQGPKIVSEVLQAHNTYLLNKCVNDNHGIRCVEEPVNIKCQMKLFLLLYQQEIRKDIKVASKIPN